MLQLLVTAHDQAAHLHVRTLTLQLIRVAYSARGRLLMRVVWISLVKVHVDGLVDAFLEYFIAHRILMETEIGELLAVIHEALRRFAHILLVIYR